MSENEKLQKLKERVEAQENKLKRIRATRGQVDYSKIMNGNLCTCPRLLARPHPRRLGAAHRGRGGEGALRQLGDVASDHLLRPQRCGRKSLSLRCISHSGLGPV